MAPIQKRVRRDRDPDDDDRDASPSVQLNGDAQRKKPKLSHTNGNTNGITGNNDDDDEDDDESSSESEREDDGPAAPDSTQYEDLRDDGFSHLQDIEDDDFHAAQAIESRKKHIVGDNRAAESGIVESITCVNFMCHERLFLPLGPLINFVTGKNGSGKSAIVAALQVCLGVKASSTSRGSALKNMIKNEREAAQVQVQIANRGPDAFHHDLYGDSIIIERNFTRRGGNNYKLKSKSGRTISHTKGDLDELIEHFAMQVENPMNILTQDRAKQFITNSGPAEKYKFFIQGTQLEQLDTDYKMFHQSTELVQAKVYQLLDDLKVLEREAEIAKKKAAAIEGRAGMKAEKKRLFMLAAWSQVQEQERVRDECAGKLDQVKKAIEDAEARAEAKTEEFDKDNERVEQICQAIQEFADDKAPQVQAETEAKEKWDAATKDLKKMKVDQRAIHQEILNAQKDVEEGKARVLGEEERLEALNGGSHSRKLAEIEKRKERVEDRKRAFERAELQTPQFQEQCTAADTACNDLDRPIQAKNIEISQANKLLQELNSDRGDTMRGYHRNMTRLLTRVRNDRGFRSMPIGPLGLHCRLLQQAWSDVLESSLGGILTAFVVTNEVDQRKLSRMTKEENIHASIYTISETLNPRLNEPDENFLTILRVLDIENVLVRNALVLHARAEQTILIEKSSDAENVLYKGSPPRNVVRCFAINEKRPGWGYVLTAGSNDTYGPIPGKNGHPKMKTDSESQIAAQQHRLNALRQDLHQLESRRSEARAEQKRRSQALLQHQKELKALKVDVQKAQAKVEDLEEELRNDQIVDGRLEGFKGMLEEAHEQLRIQEGNSQDIQEQLTAQNNLCTGLKREYEQAKTAVKSYDDQIAKLEEKRERLARNRGVSLQQKNEAFQDLEVLKSHNLPRAVKKLEDEAAEVEVYISEAEKICQRIPVDESMTFESIRARIDQITKQLDAAQKRQGATDDEITTKARKAVQALNDHKDLVRGIERMCSVLKMTLDDRINKWRKFQRHISAHSRMNFSYLLQERNFRGELTFDHKKKLLDLKVEPDATKKSAKGRVAKTLSGGEKSFSSICLLLALWEAMGAPLRILDEYDVFMDEVNRAVSTKMIISAARRSVGKQFILITPHRVGKTIEQENKDVEFIRMLDPRDPNQQSIEESMVGAD